MGAKAVVKSDSEDKEVVLVESVGDKEEASKEVTTSLPTNMLMV